MKFPLSTIAALIALSTSAIAETNPFTGVSVETEQVRAQLELQREKNNLSKEQLEAKRIEFQTKHSEKVLMADLRKTLSPPGSSVAMMLDGLPTAGEGPGKKSTAIPARKVLPKPEKALDNLDLSGLGLAARPTEGRSMPVSWAPKLVAVMDTGRGRIATIESGGEATTVAVGDRMGMGAVSEIGDAFVTVGGRTLYLDRAVIATNNPDVQDAASLTGGKAPTKPSILPPAGAILPPDFSGMPR